MCQEIYMRMVGSVGNKYLVLNFCMGLNKKRVALFSTTLTIGIIILFTFFDQLQDHYILSLNHLCKVHTRMITFT